MQRNILPFLNTWLASPDRKPLVLRGARQVGKTWIIRHLATNNNKKLLEINVEKYPNLTSIFNSNNPEQILLNLSAHFNTEIKYENTLLFIDEIQASPELLAKLRWFAEDLPQLAVVAAGSLLEFLLAEHSFSMPVGRINYMHLEPMSFEEFLLASDKKILLDYLLKFNFSLTVPNIIHEQLILLFKEYLIIGGMPAAVANWTQQKSIINIEQTHADLWSTYRDDFAKYSNKISIERINKTVFAIPKSLGHKFIYSHINPSINSDVYKQILSLLEKARICHRVRATAANGLPLLAEAKDKFFKEIMLDTGLCAHSLGLGLSFVNKLDDILLINLGAMAEQVVGQLLRTINPPFIEPSLFYWLREEKGASAEIDYLIQHGHQIVPIEVKAGSTGSLKSLHLFMGAKKLSRAVRINSDLPSQTQVEVINSIGIKVKYELISIPFYLTGQIHRILGD